MSQKEQDVINMIRETIHKAEPTAQIILYGSRARGDAKVTSDWDVLAIVDKAQFASEDRSNLEYNIWDKGLMMGEEINLFTYTKKQWDSAPPSLFKYNVLKEGILL
jgi:predicted nucleotidyltransferase